MRKKQMINQIVHILKKRSTMILWLFFLIISASVFLNIFPKVNDPSLWYITFAFVAMFMTMAIFELIMFFIDIFKENFSIKFNNKPKPKVFEFGFFLSIFIATVSASYVIAMIFQPELKDNEILEIIKQYFWFFGLYGVAIAFGVYHYLFRIDDDFSFKEKKRFEGEKMISKKNIKNKSKDYPVTISDWITFLSCESSYNIQIIFIIVTITFAAVVALIQYQGTNVGMYIAIAAVLLYVFFIYTFNRMKTKSKLVQDLLDDIIEGKLTNPKKICERWINEVKPKIRKIQKDIL